MKIDAVTIALYLRARRNVFLLAVSTFVIQFGQKFSFRNLHVLLLAICEFYKNLDRERLILLVLLHEIARTRTVRCFESKDGRGELSVCSVLLYTSCCPVELRLYRKDYFMTAFSLFI